MITHFTNTNIFWFPLLIFQEQDLVLYASFFSLSQNVTLNKRCHLCPKYFLSVILRCKILVLNQGVSVTHRTTTSWMASQKAHKCLLKWMMAMEAQSPAVISMKRRWKVAPAGNRPASCHSEQNISCWPEKHWNIIVHICNIQKPVVSEALVSHNFPQHFSTPCFIFILFLYHFCSLRYMYKYNRVHFALLWAFLW